MDGQLKLSDQTTTGVEKTSSEAPLEQSETQDTQTVPQEQDETSEKASHEPSDSKEICGDGSQDRPSKVEIVDTSSSSTAESKAPTEAQGLNSIAVASSQPLQGREYQLTFDVDDTGSEASSPRLGDMSNPVVNYLSQHHYLPSPMASQSHDLESLSHDMVSESHDHKEETVESTDVSDGAKASSNSVEDDVSSAFSSKTLLPGSASEQQGVATKPPPSDTPEKEREESVTTPDSVVKMEDITLTTVSPDGSSRDETPPPQPKEHALNILTSDSEGAKTPPYSPVPYLSGESSNKCTLCVIR